MAMTTIRPPPPRGDVDVDGARSSPAPDAPDTAEELVRTKLVAPTLPTSFVVRPGLQERLNEARLRHHPLVLVSAPAGSGKSTLVAGWIAQLHDEAAWLQVEATDGDPARFWSCLLASIGLVHPAVEEALRPLVAGSSTDGATIVAALANALTELDQPLVLVIDDFQLIEAHGVHVGVERLITMCPPHVTVLVVTRTDPPFRLGRLRVRNQLTELRADDLRFDRHDAVSLLGSRADEVDEVTLDGLVERTEGWAAGLVLAGVSMGSAHDLDEFVGGFRGSDQLVVDYLSDELLASLDPDDRMIMLQTAALDRLTGPLVDAVTGGSGSAAWLRATASANQLLVSLDRTGTWYRYQHLLRDLLRLEAADVLAGELPGLHRAAGAWHRRYGSIHDAVDHYLAGNDLPAAADLIADHATALLNGGQLQTVRDQIARLGDVADNHVGVLIVRGWVEFVTGHFANAQSLLDQAHDLDVEHEERGLIVALGIMTNVARGDIGEALRAAEQAIEPTEATQAMTMGGVRVWAGRFEDARPFLELAEEMAACEPHDFVAAITPIFMAIASLENGDAASARRQAEGAIRTAARSSMSEAPQMALAHSIVARTTTEPEQAVQSARRGIELARRSPEYIMLAYALTSGADVLHQQDNPESADLLTEARSIIDRCPDPGVAGAYLARVETRHGTEPAASLPVDLIEDVTDRELAVLRLLAGTLSQREIASELYVSLNTVKTHCRAIYRKLGVSDRKAAVQTARDFRLL